MLMPRVYDFTGLQILNAEAAVLEDLHAAGF